MATVAPLPLDRFNQQVLACQDEAFTLAFSILGNEGLACEVVQEVFLRVYANWGDDDNTIPVKMLQGVIWMCRQAKPSKVRGTAEVIPGWELLECSEQEALLLVDTLEKAYHDAALILKCSECDVARLVARGRCKLAMGFHSESVHHRETRRKRNE